MTTEKEFFYTSKRVNFTWIIFWGLKIYNYHKKSTSKSLRGALGKK